MSVEEIQKRKSEIRIFLDKEYDTLREEIKATKERQFKILISGLISAPTFAGIAEQFKLPPLYFTLPFVVLAISVFYLSESHALFRAGCFIRKQIEPAYIEICGWERWLSCRKKNFDSRKVDKYVAGTFMIMLIIYYTAAVCLAIHQNIKYIGTGTFYIILLVLYVGIGAGFFVHSFYDITTDTYEKPCKDPECWPRKFLDELSLFKPNKES